jgi:hypothetical protein
VQNILEDTSKHGDSNHSEPVIFDRHRAPRHALAYSTVEQFCHLTLWILEPIGEISLGARRPTVQVRYVQVSNLTTVLLLLLHLAPES